MYMSYAAYTHMCVGGLCNEQTCRTPHETNFRRKSKSLVRGYIFYLFSSLLWTYNKNVWPDFAPSESWETVKDKSV